MRRLARLKLLRERRDKRFIRVVTDQSGITIGFVG